MNWYLLGHPIAHSKSPAIMKAAFDELGLCDWTYSAIDCATPEEVCEILARRDWAAVSITTPYKALALDFGEVVDSSARDSMGANLLVNGHILDGAAYDQVIAYSTDGVGCIGHLLRKRVPIMDAAAVVCGTGPAALSITDRLVQTGARVTLLSRDATRAKTMAAMFLQGKEQSVAQTVQAVTGASYGTEEANRAIAEASLVIDATTVGMQPGGQVPFDEALLHEGQTVVDVVYGHGVTPTVEAAKKAGCTVFDGEGMLVMQAAIGVQYAMSQLNLNVNLSFGPLYQAMTNALIQNQLR